MAKKHLIATRIPENTFQGLQLNAGMLVKKFDIKNPTEIKEDDLVSATTGGINIVCKPTYSDLGEDVDNCPKNMKELKNLESWEVTVGTTCLNASAANIRMALGAADIDPDTGAIVPRASLSQDDFDDLWWIGDRADYGLVAAHIFNALSTEGFSYQSTDKGKGQLSLTMTGHVSIQAQDVVPIEFYSLDPEEVWANEEETE